MTTPCDLPDEASAGARAAPEAARARRRACGWLLCHLLLFLGVFQIGYTPEQWQAVRSEIALQGGLGIRETWRTIGPLGLVRSYYRTNSDERLYREYARLTLTGSADLDYIAQKHGLDRIQPLAARPWPYRDVRVEYPPLALLIGMLPPALFGASYFGYRLGLGAWMLVLQLLNVWIASQLLARPGQPAAAGFTQLLKYSFWFCLLLGTPVVTRLDALVTLALLGALLCLQRSVQAAPGAAGAWARGAGLCAGAGALIKVVPILALPVLLASYGLSRRPDRWRLAVFALGAAATLVAVVHALSWLLFGAGYLETFSYHVGRGLQLESTYAALLMLAKTLGAPIDLLQTYGWGSANLSSRLADTLARWAPLVSLLSLTALFTHAALRRALAAQALLASAVTLCVLTSKVFSPQYLIWLFPLAQCGAAPREQRRVAVLLGAAAALSQVLYPRAYSLLEQFHPLMVLLLNLRNLLLVGLLVLLWRRAVLAPSLAECS